MNINTGDIAFVMICSMLVFLMTPGLAFFYGGMVRRKNILNTLMSTIFTCGLSGLLWVLIGYSLSFGEGNSIIGGLNFICLNGVGAEPNPAYAGNIPHLLFAIFQMMFAIITPALITGSLAGRMKFSSLFIFIAIWSIFVYYPMAHMVWGDGGFLKELGALDFAGGDVVHISSGVSGLVACILIGHRQGFGMISSKPHNIPLVILGASVLWFGWFGFNAGSALAADSIAVHAFIVTNTSAAAAMLSWMLIEKIAHGKVSVLGSVTGGVVGLVAITPGAGYVPIWSSIIIGALVSPICFLCMGKLKAKFGYDDTLDAFGCHGVGGIWGGIATGIFANKSVNPAVEYNGLLFGQTQLFTAELMSILITALFAGVMTFIIIKVIQCVTKVRVENIEEARGLDISEHGESAYPAFNGLD